MALHNKILFGLILGAAIGISVNVLFGETSGAAIDTFASRLTDPIGGLWLNALIMVVIPLVISTLSLGVYGLGSLAKVGKIGGVAILTFLSLTATAATLGLFLVNTIRPGAGLDPTIREGLMAAYPPSAERIGFAEQGLSIDLLLNVVPRNPVAAAADFNMLGIIFVSLMVGVAMTQLPRSQAHTLRDLLDAVAHIAIAIINMVMKVAPYAVACLIFGVTSRFGFDLLYSLAEYVVTVIGGLAVFMAVVYPIVIRFVARRSPMEFFHKAKVVILTAFSTSSSNATLPTTLRVTEEELKVPNEVAGFVVPLGATMNMNGTALFEGVTVLFVAQVFGIELALTQQLVVVLMSVIVAIGAAGVPGGSIPLLMMVLAMVGAPMEGIAIVLGVDRILDMCRTTTNVVGDMVTSTVVSRFANVRHGTII